VESSRNFINKIWNAARFVLMNLPEGHLQVSPVDLAQANIADRWILHRLDETIATVTQFIERYDFGEAGRALYDFAWDDFCDWYIEFSKLALYGDDAAKKANTTSVLVHVLDALLRLMHPFAPFVTEEIWQSLPVSGDALIVAEWPVIDAQRRSKEAAEQIEVVMEAIRAVRNIRAQLNVAPSKPVAMLVQCKNTEIQRLLKSAEDYLVKFCNLNTLTIETEMEIPEQVMSAVITGADIYLPLSELVDLKVEVERLRKEEKRLQGEVDRVEKKLSNEQFIAKAPDDVVAAERIKAEDYKAKLTAVQERIKSIRQA
jgi:valyl-tRNA synthetase